ncbi:hypothetical protein ACFV0R_22315 [Streptomyces sp. NPDC059578]|uniref:hypothetical protein n=1 Tax=Streptomyces sp. NPDC059578 TaxID=3346874 RepID=UPI0036A4C206
MLLQFADAALDRVASAVLLVVEGRWAASGPAASAAVRPLVVRLCDRGSDPAFAQVQHDLVEGAVQVEPGVRVVRLPPEAV